MDPLTQGAIGASLSLATRQRRLAVTAAGLGFLAGMAPDLDVFIRSETDTLLYLEYHRQFTHSLVFVPIGSALVAGPLYFLLRRRLGFLQIWLFCALGYATHGVLDTATSYGTMLFWPFSETRYSWSIVSVIDPLFTLPVLAMVITGAIRRSGWWGRGALAWGAAYLLLGVYQHQAALDMGRELAALRGHDPVRLEAKPSFANIVVWKIVYETGDTYHVDAVRPTLSPRVFKGTQVAKLDLARDFPWLDPNSQQARDVERFRWFSQGFVAQDPVRKERVIDVRYSVLPNEISALWSITLAEGISPDAHAVFSTHRGGSRDRMAALWRMIIAPPVDRPS